MVAPLADRTAKTVALGIALLELVLTIVAWAMYSVPSAASGTRFQLELPPTGSPRSVPGSRWASTASRW